ncbi:MAG TPA: flagellar filament capping protein FliD [Tepidisphaeraceae bacterium]|jgi:flagellar hook-associated protein 2
MGTITSSIGLVSGINTGQIIDELMSLESQPVKLIQTRIDSANVQMQAYNDLESQLSSLHSLGLSLERPSNFHNSTAVSTDPGVLTATTKVGATQGSYQFQVARLVSSQQSVSNGYTSADAPLQAGTISFDLGGGSLSAQTNLADLNGGAGVGRGQFRIIDANGKADVINTQSAITLDDVVTQINTSLNISVKASIQNNKLVITDSSGGAGTLNVQDLNGGSSAKDLGIAGAAVAGTLNGTRINYLATGTALTALNDGRGVRQRTSGSADFNVALADGSTIAVDLKKSRTVGDVIAAINTASPSKLKAAISASGTGITLTDQTTGGGTLSVTDVNGSHAGKDLGLQTGASGNTINGSQILAGLDSVLVSSLKGGSGISLGSVTINDRNGGSSTVNFAGATSVQDLLDKINKATGVSVNASLNSSSNGIQIQDTSGGSGNLVIADDSGGTTAASLGIAGTFDTTKTVVDGGNLHVQYISEGTQLTDYNGGKGITPGSFTISSALGASVTIDTTSGTFNSLGDVINAINANHMGVSASVNTNGNGLLLTDTSGGPGKMIVQDVSGTVAKDLGIAGTATGTTLDGSLEKTIAVLATDTLSTLVTKINAITPGVAASVINDGSSQSPYRLSLTSLNPGKAGRVTISGGTTGLQLRNLVDGQDAAVFIGGTGTSQPLMVTSHSNLLTGIIPGVTVTLQSASDKPVTLNINRDPTNVSTQLQSFTDTFNTLVDKLATYTQFDTTTNQGSVLLGDATAQQIQTKMYEVFRSSVKGAGGLQTLGDVGITITDGGKLTFDGSKFESAYAHNADSVSKLFSDSTAGLGKVIDNSINSLVDPISGSIARENTTLQNQKQQFQDQITQLDSLLVDKRNRLEQQFANMETVLSDLQSQQSALGAITSVSLPVAKSTTTK